MTVAKKKAPVKKAAPKPAAKKAPAKKSSVKVAVVTLSVDSKGAVQSVKTYDETGRTDTWVKK